MLAASVEFLGGSVQKCTSFEEVMKWACLKYPNLCLPRVNA